MSAVQVAGLLSSPRLSAAELTGAFLDRIEAVNPALNAIVTLAPERALADAARLDPAGVGFPGELPQAGGGDRAAAPVRGALRGGLHGQRAEVAQARVVDRDEVQVRCGDPVLQVGGEQCGARRA